MFWIPASAGMTTIIYCLVKRYFLETGFSTIPSAGVKQSGCIPYYNLQIASSPFGFLAMTFSTSPII